MFLRTAALVGFVCFLVVAVGGIGPAGAEEVKGRWRVELKLGGIDPGDSIQSEVANAMQVQISEGDVAIIPDPRPNLASTIEGRLSSDPRIDLRVGYGLAAWKNFELILDGGIGYYTTKVVNLELHYAHDIDDPQYEVRVGNRFVRVPGCETLAYAGGDPQPRINCLPFTDDAGGPEGGILDAEDWHYLPITGGEIDNVPVSLSLLARFRPTKKLNPYIGGGVGYMLADFTPSAQWVEFADALDASWVQYTRERPLSNPEQGQRILIGEAHDLQRPNIEVPDTAFIEARGGMEWQWRPKIAFFLESSFFWAADEIVVTVDGREKFGTPTPDSILVPLGDPSAFNRGGRPAYIICGGIEPGELSGQPCSGAGEYYFNGGRLDYGGFNWQVGVRWTL
jgi:hypothetical protein